jgi:glycosyltransferase involved in cell wall biosynthesis
MAQEHKDCAERESPALVPAVRAPTLSVVIPAYNVESFIADAVNSALTQTLTDLEVVVVDDGSTDRTAEIVTAMTDPRIRLVDKPNGGLSSARNAGIRAARGRYIGLLDGDDRWLEAKAARHVEAMERDPTIGVTFSQSAYIDEQGRRTGQLLTTRLAEPTLHDLIRYNHLGNGSTPVVRKDVFEAVGLFDEQLRASEDYDVWIRVLHRRAGRIVLIDEVLTEYRVRESSLSMEPDVFVPNGEAVHAKLCKELIEVPRHVLDHGLANIYRIAGRKCLSTGRIDEAWKWMTRARRTCPRLFMVDRKSCAVFVLTAMAYMLPEPIRGWPHGCFRIGYRLMSSLAAKRSRRMLRPTLSRSSWR